MEKSRSEPSRDTIKLLRAYLKHDAIRTTGPLPENIADVIERFIERQELSPATLLGTKAELTAVFAVAPSTLSEATKILTSRGAVRLRSGPKGGVVVAEQRPVLRLARSMIRVSEGDVSVAHLAEVRDALEETVLRDAFEHRTENHLLTMRQQLEVVEQARNATDFYRAVLGLHSVIADACANDFLKLVYVTAIRTLAGRTQLVSQPGDEEAAMQLRRERYQVHRGIIDAIETQNENEFAKALARHAEYLA